MPSEHPHDRIPASPIRAHVAELTKIPGVYATTVADAAGISRASLGRVLKHGTGMRRWTAEAVLAVTPEMVTNRRRLVAAEPVRQHLLRILAEDDCEFPALVNASGFTRKEMRQLLAGEREHVYPETARALLRLTVRAVRNNTVLVPARTAITRLRALQANGWRLEDLGNRLGVKGRRGLWFVYSFNARVKDCGVINAARDRQIKALYDEIGDTPGDSVFAANWAKKLGYHPPEAYDDDMRLIRAPDHERERRWLRMLGLTLRGRTGDEIAKMLDVSRKQVERRRLLLGLRLDANATTLADYVQPGQDALVAAIRAAVEPISLLEDSHLLDEPGLDYKAIWRDLVTTAGALRARPAADVAA
jgi:hypothetical protein